MATPPMEPPLIQVPHVLLMLCLAVWVPHAIANDAVRGGQLWDSWWTVTAADPPSGMHPLYPEDGPLRGPDTFRCAQCHGWDYRGVSGAFATGPSYTGIEGVLNTQRSDADIFNLLKFSSVPGGHGLGKAGLQDQDIRDLIAFLKDGLLDTTPYITPDGSFIGDADRGAQNFKQGTTTGMQCIVCHGPDGRWLNFGSATDPKWIGSVADDNPWQMLHTIRFGKPGSVMPSWFGLRGDVQTAADIGRYAQDTLPATGLPDTQPATPVSYSPGARGGLGTAGFTSLQLAAPVALGDPMRAEEHPIIAHVLLEDLDQDGMLDAIACDVDRHEVVWMRQNPDGSFTERVIGANIDAPVHAEVADMDGDGDLDVLVAGMGIMLPSTEMIGTVIMLENDGDDQFTTRVLADKTHRVTDVRPGDLDGDGDLDLAIAQFGYVQGAVQWMENMGDGSFQMHHLMDRSGAIHSPMADIDGDGDLDIIALFSQEWETLQAFVNDGRGGFTPLVLHDVADADFSSSGIDVGDIDGDGDVDIAWANGDAFVSVGYRPLPTHGVQWLENLGQYQFAFHRIGQFDGAYGPTIADMDSDGDADIVAVSEFANWSEPGTPSVRWWSQQKDGSFLMQDLAEEPTHLVTCDVGDIDDDGWPDIVAGGMALYPPFDRVTRVVHFQSGPGAMVSESVAQAVIPKAVDELLATAQDPGQRGMIFHANALPIQADESYAQASQRDITNPRWPYYRGLLAAAIGDSQSAIVHFKQAAERDPTYAPLHIRLGQLHAGQGNRFAAEQAWTAAGDEPMAIMGMAQLAADARQWNQVVTLLEGRNIRPAAALLALGKARSMGLDASPVSAMDMGLQPVDPWLEDVQSKCVSAATIVVNAQINFIAGRYDQAERLLRSAVAIDPSDTDARLALATLLMMPGRESPGEAMDHLNIALSHDPHDLAIRTQHAWAMYVAGHRDEAAARWAAIIDEEPAHTPALFHIAQWHGQSGRPTEALTYYRRFMAVPRDTAFSGTFEGPQRSQWLLRYALAAKEAGFAQEALVASEQAATLTPGDHAARFQTGNLLIKLKRFEEAVAHLEAAAALRPTDAHTLAAAGYAMFKIGQLDAAVQRLDAAVQADPNFALGWYHLGTVYQQLGQRDEAIAAFSMAVRLKPRFRQARQALEALQQGR